MNEREDRPRRQKSSAEIEGVSRVADCLLDLERRAALSDSQIALLARAIDAVELGSFAAAASLADAARGFVRAPADARPEHAHALVQRLAFQHLRGRLLRAAAGTGHRPGRP